MGLPEVLLALGLLVLVAGVALGLNAHSHRSLRRNVERLAGRFGLEEVSGPQPRIGLWPRPPALHGTWEGRELALEPVATGWKGTRQSVTALHMETSLRKDAIVRLRSRRGLNRLERSDLGKLTRVAGHKPEFDQRISVATNLPAWFVLRFPASTADRVLDELGTTAGSITLAQGRLSYHELGLPAGKNTAARLERVTLLLAHLATTLESPSDEAVSQDTGEP